MIPVLTCAGRSATFIESKRNAVPSSTVAGGGGQDGLRAENHMCVKYFGPSNRDLISGSTSPTTIWITGWLPALSAKKIKSLIRLDDSSDNFQVQLAIQTAETDTDSPDTAIAKGVVIGSDIRVCSGVLDITTDVASKFFVRVGLIYKNSGGTAMERGKVSVAFGLEA
jgi:hypothetical protein